MSDVTSPAIEFLRGAAIEFSIHQFEYVPGGGTPRSSSVLGLDEHAIFKTLVFENQDRNALIVLMHGDRHVDTKILAAQLGMSKIWSCAPAVAESISGWPVGATNPFALKTSVPIYIEASALELPKMYVNGGGRGLLVGLTPSDFIRLISPGLVRCAKEKPMVVSKSP